MKAVSVSSVCSNKRELNREACWAFGLTILYGVAWSTALVIADSRLGVVGVPLWFEWVALRLPILFIVSCTVIIRCYFRHFSFDN